MLASMKQQFVELLSDIGFIKEGITVKDVERRAIHGSDGVIDVTGSEVVQGFRCLTYTIEITISVWFNLTSNGEKKNIITNYSETTLNWSDFR